MANTATDTRSLVKSADRFIEAYGKLNLDISDCRNYSEVWALFNMAGGLQTLEKSLASLVQRFEEDMHPCAKSLSGLLDTVWSLQTLGPQFWALAQESKEENYTAIDGLLHVKLRELWMELLQALHTPLRELCSFVDDYYRFDCCRD